MELMLQRGMSTITVPTREPQSLLPRALPTKDTISLGCHTMEIMEEAMEETTEESTPSTGITEEEDTT